MSTLSRDLRYALRTLRASPGYSAVAIITIALAIGANTAMFSFVNGMLLNPLPYPDPDRIVRVLEKRPDGGRNGVSTLNYLDWVEQNEVFQYMAAQTGWGATLTGGEEPVQLRGQRVSPHYFDINGTRPALGRTFRPDEDQVGKDHVVLLSHTLWETQFGSDPSIVGQDIFLDGEPYTVVGVLQEGGAFDRSAAQIWKPLAFEPSNMTRNFHWFGGLAKLKPGVTLEQARAEMDAIGQRIAQEYPDSNKGWSVAVDRYADLLIGPQLRTAVTVLFSATAFVLLIGCANLANLALARGVSREREVAVRASLGAGRWRLARQFLTENVMLSVCGGIVGIGVGFGTMKWITSMIPPYSLPAEVDIRMDMQVLLFAFAVAVATGLLFGLAPAVQAARTSLAGSMKDGGHGTTAGGSGRRVRGTLAVAEIALAFVLLVGSGLLMRSFFSLLNVDPGFDSTNVLTARLPIAQQQHPDPDELNTYLDSIRSAVEAVPGVRETAVTSALPLQGWGYGMPYQIAGRETVDRAHRKAGFFKMVSPSYFSTLGISLLKGRVLTERDTAGAPNVLVINETLAKSEFKDEDPIGRRILVQKIVPGQTALGDEIPWEIVGVIADEKINGLNDDSSGGMYVSNRQSPAYGISLIVRAGLEPLTLEKAIRAAVDTVNKDQALSQVRTLEQIESQSLIGDRIESLLLGIFAAIALVLATVGIYGVISYAVVQRTHEIGIRGALGASAGSLRGLMFKSGMKLTLLGLAIGVAGSLAVTRVMASMLYGVGTRDPYTMVAVAVALAAVAAAACYVPARRATKVDPMVALRYQ
jgi:putative ABC transport system permease protein